MSDRSSAAIYGSMFDFLAKLPPGPMRTRAVKRFWRESMQYDFSPEQMGCDRSLSKLGLARKRVPDDYPEDGPCWHYGPPGDDAP